MIKSLVKSIKRVHNKLCTVLPKTQRKSVRTILVVVGIERETYLNPVL